MQDEPLPPAAAFVMLAAFVFLAVSSFSLWVWASTRLKFGAPLIEETPRPKAPWGLVDIASAVFIYLVLLILAVTSMFGFTGAKPNLGAELSLDLQVQMFTADSLAKLAALGVTTFYLFVRYFRPWADLGWIGLTSKSLLYGAAGFAMAAMPVYAIQLVLTQFFPSAHPLIEVLKEDPRPSFFLASAFAAVIVAPLFEEYFIRVLFQGWLDSLARGGSTLQSAILGESRPLRARPVPPAMPAPNAAAANAESPSTNGSAAVMPSGDPSAAAPAVAAEVLPEAAVPASENPYVATVAPVVSEGFGTAELPPNVANSAAPPKRSAISYFWPVCVSSLLFAALHIGHGPDPIPLFFLALALGYLYQRTGSVWPGVIMHAIFNAWSLGLLWLYVSAS